MVRSAALVLLVALFAAAVGCQKKPAPDDHALAQGEWVIVSIETPEIAPGEERELNQMKNLVIVVTGDLVTITHPREKGGIAATFALDQTKTPREFDATDVVVTGEGAGEMKVSGVTRGLYKFEGDELVVALPLGDGKNLPRPTEFKAFADKENRRGVFVFHLKKK